MKRERKMKAGDLVRMNLNGWGAPDDMWGMGVVLRVVYESESIDIEVLWSKLGLSWEMPAMLEIVSESG